jgi:hypothetical protein
MIVNNEVILGLVEHAGVLDFWVSVRVDAQDDVTRPPGKMERVVEAGDEFRNGFSDIFCGLRPAPPGA